MPMTQGGLARGAASAQEQTLRRQQLVNLMRQGRRAGQQRFLQPAQPAQPPPPPQMPPRGGRGAAGAASRFMLNR